MGSGETLSLQKDASDLDNWQDGELSISVRGDDGNYRWARGTLADFARWAFEAQGIDPQAPLSEDQDDG